MDIAMPQVRTRLAMVLAATMLATTNGLAYAGSLPDAAQDAARSALAPPWFPPCAASCRGGNSREAPIKARG
jgi:hypothetical protein